MGYKATEAVLLVDVGSVAGKCVLFALAAHANNETFESYPSLSTLASECNTSKRTVITHLDKLVEMGVIEKRARYNSKGQTSNGYKIIGGVVKEVHHLVKQLHHPSEGASPKSVSEPVNESEEQRDIEIMATPKIELDFSPLNMTPDLVDEVKAIRKANTKGKPLTQRIINTLGKEFAECRAVGATDDQILNEWSVRAWQGFKAEWFLRDFKRPGQGIAQTTSRPTKYQQQMADQEAMKARFLGIDQHQGHTYEHER